MKSLSSHRRSRTRAAWLFMAPMLAALMVVAIWPLARTVGFSFTDASLSAPGAAAFIGLENYAVEDGGHWYGLVADPLWWESVGNTLIFAVGSVALEVTGGLFGKRYDLLEPTSATSLNLPWHIETYVNFGSVGVVVGMALIGAFLALLDKLLNAPGRRELEMGIGLGILMPLTFQDSNLSVMVGTLPQFVLCLYLYFLAGEFVLRRLGMGPPRAESVERD